MNMALLLLLYGFTFLVIGVVVAVQALCWPSELIPRRAMALLAIATATNGAKEWLIMGAITQRTAGYHDAARELSIACIVCMTLSFWAFGQFAAETLVAHTRAPSWTRHLPAAMLALTWATLLSANLLHPPFHAMWKTARWLLGMPSLFAASYALLVASRSASDDELRQPRRGLRHASTAFAAFAVVVLAPGTLVPASLHSDPALEALVRLSTQALGTACAIVIAWLLIKALVVEAARARAAWERQREEFIAVVAHDLGNPLQAILLNAARLDRATPERLHESGARITKSANMMARLVHDLVDASRIDLKKVELQRTSIDLDSLVTLCLEQSNASHDHAVDVDVRSLPRVFADPDRIVQVLVNLLSNARKYSPAGSSIAVSARATATDVVVSVENGGTIAPSEASHLFSRFYRTTQARGSAARGLGLGLYIARGLVEAHGGRIWVDLAARNRVAFRFGVPRADAEPAARALATERTRYLTS